MLETKIKMLEEKVMDKLSTELEDERNRVCENYDDVKHVGDRISGIGDDMEFTTMLFSILMEETRLINDTNEKVTKILEILEKKEE